MKSEKSKIDRALVQVRNLMGRLRVAPDREDGELDGDAIMSFTHGFGGFRITGAEAKLYRQCCDALNSLDGKSPDTRVLSRKASEELLRKAIIRTLRPARLGETESREIFERRLARELGRVRRGLLATSEEWTVTVQVRGLAQGLLPFTFGAIAFEEGTGERARVLASHIPDLDPRKRPHFPHSVAAENAVRVKARTELIDAFAKFATASLTVRAGDDEAARHIGLARVRRTVDIINFFASFLDEPRERQGRAFVPPDGPRTHVLCAVTQSRGFLNWWPPFPADIPVHSFDVTSTRAKDVGLTKAHDILLNEGRSDLEQRIVNALSWAGRAKVEPEPAQAFLLYAIALEALLTKTGARNGVTDRLRLRIAHLLGSTPAGRKRVFDIVGDLYDLRSALVHAGDSSDLDTPDLNRMRNLVNRVLTAMLIHDRYVAMRSAREFEQWLDAQVLAGGPSTAGMP